MVNISPILQDELSRKPLRKKHGLGMYNVITLRCGHVLSYLLRFTPKAQKHRCLECESLRRNKVGVIHGERPHRLQEVWDEATQMPKMVAYLR